MEVENDGDAIPAGLMKHLFEPFTGQNEDGHGLGLWVTHQIIEQLKGRIEVESREGRTRFSVKLPKGDSVCLPNASA
jgi:two-component system NtrC family sensor kinase